MSKTKNPEHKKTPAFMRKPRFKASQVNLEKRRGMVLELALQGGTYQQICDQLKELRDSGEIEEGIIPPGYTSKEVFADLRAELSNSLKNNKLLIEEYRELEDRRMDTLMQACQEGVRIGDTNSINTVIRLSETKRRLWGLDAPVKTEVSGPDGGPIQVEDVRGRLYDKLFGHDAPRTSQGGSDAAPGEVKPG